jgi:hypothetical protein
MGFREDATADAATITGWQAVWKVLRGLFVLVRRRKQQRRPGEGGATVGTDKEEASKALPSDAARMMTAERGPRKQV